jgi:endonuclease III
MTTAPSYERVHDRLRRAIGDWNRLVLVPVGKLKRLIRDAGLSSQKAPRLLAIAEKLRTDFGSVTLEPLRHRSDEQALAYLVSLPAVGLKTAKCVLMYSLGRKVLPVDTHLLRLGRRVGLIPAGTQVRLAHHMLEEVVPPRHRYDFHVNGIAHGRSICRARLPRCGNCRIAKFCDSAFLPELVASS